MQVFWYWPFARAIEMPLAQSFADLGHDLTVQVIDRDAAPTPADAAGFTLKRNLGDVDRSRRGVGWLASRAKTYRDRSAQRRELIESTSPDVVHFHYANRFTDATFTSRTPWVLSVHDVEPHQPRLGPLEPALLRRLYSRPDQLVVHHRWLAEQLQDRFDIWPSRITVVPLQVFPIDNPQPRPTTSNPMVLSFGALRPNKGIDALITAMKRPELADARLHIAGRGNPAEEQRLQELAAVVPNVDIEVGFISESRKCELFQQASVVALNYRTFSSVSAVLTDAYGHGRPLVATDVGALGSIIRDDGTGQIVPVGDQQALCDAIVAMLGPAGDVAGRNGRAAARNQRAEAIAPLLADLYQSLTT